MIKFDYVIDAINEGYVKREKFNDSEGCERIGEFIVKPFLFRMGSEHYDLMDEVGELLTPFCWSYTDRGLRRKKLKSMIDSANYLLKDFRADEVLDMLSLRRER